MQRNTVSGLVGILLLSILTIYFALPHVGGITIGEQIYDYRRGLDLQGGLHVVLAPDLAEGQTIETAQLDAAQEIIERRE